MPSANRGRQLGTGGGGVLWRTPLFGLPSAVHYRLPAAIYTKAHILFALDPDSRKDAVLTVRLGHYINNGSGGNMLGDVVIDLRDRKPLEYPGIEQVGTVQHRGRELPLYLATVDLAQAIGKIIDIAAARLYRLRAHRQRVGQL